jgi:hypothetical protein
MIRKEPVIARRDRSLCPTVDTGPGLTEQAHKEQCDINLILKDYTRTGLIKHAKQNAGRYDDFTSVDYEKAQNTVAQVKSLFEGLPSSIRLEFNHNPSEFLNYMQNPDNADLLAKRGISIGLDGINIRGDFINKPDKQSSSASREEVSSEPRSEQASDSAAGKATSD